MERTVDIAILGGGCAGLSLATRLALDPRTSGSSFAVLEARREYSRDRTWCFWSGRDHPFEEQISHRWTEWSIRNEGRTTVHRSSARPYAHLPADRFYSASRAAIEAFPGGELRTGLQVERVEDRGGRVAIETSEGTWWANRVVDTRPPPRHVAAPEGALLQHFVGWEVRCDKPVFDPGRVTLMDFDVEQDAGIHFFYVLPFAADRALVEATFFSTALLDPSEYARRIDAYLENRFDVRGPEILWQERGVVPMHSAPLLAEPSPRIHHAGQLARATRPSSGYAFMNIQRMADELVEALLDGRRGSRTPSARSRTVTALDRIFLQFLRREPERAPEAFERLFTHVLPESFARFMTEESRLGDLAAVVGAMPKLPFARAALSRGHVA